MACRSGGPAPPEGTSAMPADNEIYNQPGDIWWDEQQPLHAIRTSLNPARLQYFASVFSARELVPAGKVIIDVGCGGGLMAEEIAQLGATVIGIDPSATSIATARAHAAGNGLAIDYRVGSGERLPADDGCADVVYCVDVLEHVADLDAVISETARVLKPGGLYLFDTINRTRRSKLAVIKVSQQWAATAWMPPGLHDWDQFITPAELGDYLARHGLRQHGLTGMAPAISPPALLRLVRQVKRGKLSYADFGRRAAFTLTSDLRISYLGHATKDARYPAPGRPASHGGAEQDSPSMEGPRAWDRRLRSSAAGSEG
jgi:2-polyprenyl-6-hydroxyphenyl methylase/3-demethylubiquinone-9 3-methyltransferase